MEEKRRQQGGKIRAGCKTIAFKFLIRPSCRAVEVSELPWPRAATCSEASPLTRTYDENPWPADVHRVQPESERWRTMPAGFPALDAFRCRGERRDCGSDAASRTVVRGRANLGLAMPQHLGSVSGRSAVPRIVVLRKTPDDVPQFVKQYRDLRFRSVPVVTRNRQREVTTGPQEHSHWVQLHDARSVVEERSVRI